MSEDRVLHVDPTDIGAALNLQNITIANGHSNHGGGLRINNGLTTLKHTIFQENSASNTGGAIHIDLGTLHIISSTIQDNYTNGLGGGLFVFTATTRIENSSININNADEGGGIYSTAGSLSLQHTRVISNSAISTDGDGGGIYVFDGALLVTDESEIAFNTANNNGGGIYSHRYVAPLIENSWIHHNQSVQSGGGVVCNRSYGISLILRDNIIEYNKTNASGGGVYANCTAIINSNMIAHNTANAGGGIYGYGYGSSLSISNTTFMSNTAFTDGGGISSETSVIMRNSVLRNNQAAIKGGGIFFNSVYGAIIEDSLFAENSASTGGALHGIEYSTFNIDRSTFSDNNANYGGAFFLEKTSAANIRNSTLAHNKADTSGGAIYIEHDTQFNGGNAFGLEYSTVVSNTAVISAGGIFAGNYLMAQSSIVAGNNAAMGNTADCYLGGKLLSGGNNILGTNTGCPTTRYDQTIFSEAVFTTLLEPLADNGGAALPNNESLETFALANSSPAIDTGDNKFCPSLDQRGISRAGGTSCDIGAYESDFSATIIPPVDHIITVDTTADDVDLNNNCTLREAVLAANTDTAVDHCTAGDGWDVITLSSYTYTKSISETILITDNVTIRGQGTENTIIDGLSNGQIFLVNEAALKIEETAVINGHKIVELSNNTYGGGCIDVSRSLALMDRSLLSHCVITGTSFHAGGGIHSELAVTRFANSTIKQSISGDYGGGLSSNVSVLSLNNSKLISNTTTTFDGGGIHTFSSAIRLSNSQILSNTAEAVGGGIATDYSALIINEGTEIKFNRSDSRSAAIDTDGTGTAVDNTTISQNATLGYAPVLFQSSWVRNVIIEENESAGFGSGAIGGWIQNVMIRSNKTITNGGNLEIWGLIENSHIENNEAPKAGGINLNRESLIIKNCTIQGNNAIEYEGGGLHLYAESAAIILDSTIQDNTTTIDQNGGGIYTESPVMIRRSTISNNVSGGNGGGIYNSSVVDVLNSTVSSNRANNGGGFFVLSGTLSINYSTIANNQAQESGGGIHNANTTTIESSIVAGNHIDGDLSNGTADCSNSIPFTFAGHSIFGEGTGCLANGRFDQTTPPANVFITLLHPLENYGGNTETHALVNNNIAIDAGNATNCPATDQRGISRPRLTDCDSGAFETEFTYVFLPIIIK